MLPQEFGINRCNPELHLLCVGHSWPSHIEGRFETWLVSSAHARLWSWTLLSTLCNDDDHTPQGALPRVPCKSSTVEHPGCFAWPLHLLLVEWYIWKIQMWLFCSEEKMASQQFRTSAFQDLVVCLVFPSRRGVYLTSVSLTGVLSQGPREERSYLSNTCCGSALWSWGPHNTSLRIMIGFPFMNEEGSSKVSVEGHSASSRPAWAP